MDPRPYHGGGGHVLEEKLRTLYVDVGDRYIDISVVNDSMADTLAFSYQVMLLKGLSTNNLSSREKVA